MSSTPTRSRVHASSKSRAGFGNPVSQRRRHGWLIALAVVAVILLAIQLLGSPLANHFLNKKLETLPGFAGHSEKVHLAFWRGELDLEGTSLRERGHEREPPFLKIKKTTFRFAPSALLKGELGGTCLVEGAELRVVKRETDPASKERKDAKQRAAERKKAGEQQKQKIKHWQDVLRNSFPMSIERFELRDARIDFLDVTHTPAVDVAIDHLTVVARDLENRPKGKDDAMPAKLDASGVMTGGGKLKFNVELDPLAKQPRFKANLELLEQQLVPLNPFLNAVADADVSRGTFELYSEINADNGGYNGYVKPMFHDLDFHNASDKDKSPAKLLKEKVVSMVAGALKNDDTQQVATKAPFEGNFADNEVDIWTTIANLLRNAFVEAIVGGFEGQTPKK